MAIRIKSTQFKLTPPIKAYIEEKMGAIEKYLGDIPLLHIDVEVGTAVGNQQSGKIYRAEVNLDLPHELIRVEKTEADLYKAVDKVKDHLARAIKKYKEQRIDKRRREKAKAKQ